MKSAYLFALTVLVLFAQAPFAETVYKGTDANGNTIYSDQPMEHGKKIEITVTPTFKSTPVPQETQIPKESQAIIDYKVSIVEPSDQQTFTNDITAINVKLSVTPALQKTEQLRLIVNGQPFGSSSSSPTFVLNEFPRGAYSISAEVFSVNDPTKVYGKSQTITIYQQRAIAKRDVPNLAPQAKQAPQAP